MGTLRGASPSCRTRGGVGIVYPKSENNHHPNNNNDEPKLMDAPIMKKYTRNLPGNKEQYESEMIFSVFDISCMHHDGVHGNVCQLQLCHDSKKQLYCYVVDACKNFSRRGIRFVACPKCMNSSFEQVGKVRLSNRGAGPKIKGVTCDEAVSLIDRLSDVDEEKEEDCPAALQQFNPARPLLNLNDIHAGKSNGFITLIG